MRQPFRSIPILLLILVSGAVPAFAAPTLVRTLPNKSTLVLRENRTRPIVSIQAWIKSGSRDESRSERGAAASQGACASSTSTSRSTARR